MRVFIPAPMRYSNLLVAVLSAGLATSATSAFAQDESAPAEGAAADSAASAAAEEEEDGFPIRRGFFAIGDFGGYFSFGGRNTNLPPTFPTRTVSNLQPSIGLTLGYDLVSNESINFAAGIRLGMAFNAGAGRLSDSDIDQLGQATASTAPADYDLMQAGVAFKLGFMVLERLAINAVADVGAGFVSPDPSAPASQPDGGDVSIGVLFGVGPGIEFFTLFPGFSVGLDLRFVGTIANEFTPGLSITAPLKYNF
ncbi:MAG: adventurous gliding motility protein CglE [Myxococcota bacterium]